MAQNSWKVCFNGKEVLKASGEDEARNVITINKADLKKKKAFTITFKEDKKQNGWERTIAVYGEKDAELTKQKGARFELSNEALRALFEKSKTLEIYTWALPADPKLKAAIRVRRVHLCTLVLQ